MGKEAFQIDRPALQRIWDAFGLGRVQFVEQIVRGGNNPTLIVNDSLVIRFDGIINEGVSRFWGEKRAYDALRQASIPAPQIMVVDDSRTLAACDYCIMTKVEGTPLIESWPALPANKRESAAYEAGQLLARMHTITFDHFGRLYGSERIFGTWYAYIEDTFLRYSQEALDDGLISPDVRDRMCAVLAQSQPVFDGAPARLVHWDYHFENILHQDGHITGILDFEWALAGDPAHDFNRRDQWEDNCPGSRAPLYAGYTSISPLQTDHDLRVSLYQLIWYLDCVIDAAGTDEADVMRHELLSMLETLE